MGAKKGFPDIQILERTANYSGLFIELKSKTGKASKEQKGWCTALNNRGYYAVIMPTGLDFEQGLDWLKGTVNEYFKYGLNKGE